MGLDASKAAGGAPRTPPLAAAAYPGRLVQVVDLGLQPRSYQGQEKEPVQEISLTYELVDTFLLDEDGEEDPSKPRWVSESFPLFNLDSEKAKSTLRYKILDPEMKYGGDFAKCVNTPVMVSIVQNPSKRSGRVYNNVSGLSIMRAKEAERCPELVNEPRIFDLDAPDQETFDKLPEWVQDKITSNLNWKGSEAEKVLKVREDGSGSKEASTEDTVQVAGDVADDNPY